MAMNVSVPLHLLEDILRLLEYLNAIGNRDDLNFNKNGYMPLFKNDIALWELRLKIERLQAQIVEKYLLTVDDVTDDERRDLMKWIEDGKSVYDNPFSIYDGSGCTMDFINGCRLMIDMYHNPSNYWDDATAEWESDNWIDEDLPF
jgi:hypothetical protein